MKQFTLKSLLLVLTILMGGVNAWGETYQHVFTSKPSTGNNVTLSEVDWNIEATNLFGYNSTNYAGVQIGSKSSDGSITLTSSSDWNYNGASKITEVRLWLNMGGTSVTPSVSIGGIEANSDGTVVVKNSQAGSDYTKATKVTFTPADNGDKGQVVINVTTVKAGYICAIEIDCEKVEGEVSLPTFSLAEGTYWTEQTLELTTTVENGTIYYTTDGRDPKTSETAIEYSAPIQILKSTTVKACVKVGEENFSAVAERTYTFPVVFSSLEELVDSDLTSGTLVTVSFTDMSITNIYVTSSGYRNGVYLNIQKEGNDIEIYCNNVPEEWKIEDKLTGTITGQWKLYNGVWEIVPVEEWDWTKLTYIPAPLKTDATLDFSNKVSLFIGESDEYTVDYDGDGVLSVESSDPSVATATIEGSTVTITPVAKGKTTITVSAPSTENYYAIEKSYDLYVSAPLIPAASGYESVDFTKIEPYVSLSSGKNVDVEDYQGQSFMMVFAKPQGSSNSTKYYENGKAVRAYTGNTITITAAEEIVAVKVNYVSGYVDTGEKVSGLGTKEVVISSSKTCRFTSIDVYYRGSSLPATDGTANYATFSSDKAVEFVDATVYAVNVVNGVLQLNEVTSKQVPADTGVLLKSEKETAPYFYINEAATIDNNLLKPASLMPASQEMSGSDKFYKLAYDNYEAKTGLGFYWGAENGGVFTVKAGTAYLAVPNAASVKGFLLDGTPTAIEGVEAENNTDVIYNLSGQRVQKAQRGLYIVNGKKFMVK